MICMKCGEKIDFGVCHNCDFDISKETFALLPFLNGKGIGQLYHSMAIKKYRISQYGIDKEYIRLEELAADEGCWHAMMWLAHAYTTGYSFKKPELTNDRIKQLSLYWYHKAIDTALLAASDEDVRAQFSLGQLYLNFNGWYVDREIHDYVKAKKYLFESLEKGIKASNLDIGLMYRDGLGVDKDSDEAIKYFKSYSGGRPGYCEYLLGSVYYDGPKRDYEKAHEWFRISAEKGFKLSMSMLAKMYRHGEGVGKDIKTAEYWEERNKTLEFEKNTF